MIITEQHRITARENREHKRKMSATVAQRLRKATEDRERAAEAEASFIKTFGELETDSWTMRQLLERISHPAKEPTMTREELDDYYDRRALKLRRCLAMGWNPQSVRDVILFAELTPFEWKMSGSAFYEQLTADWPETKPVRVLSDRQKLRNKSLWKSTTWGAAQSHLGAAGHAAQFA